MTGDNAFDRETAVRQLDDGRWTSVIHPAWNINQNPNGGYVHSVLLRAMIAEVGKHVDPLSLTTHFLRPATTDAEAELQVSVIRRGRRTSTVRGSMVQDGKVRLEAVCALGDLPPIAEAGNQTGMPDSQSDSQRLRLSIDPPDIPPPDQCVNRLELAQGVDLALLSRVEVRVDPEQAASPSADSAELTGWVRFVDERPVDTLALAMFADALPPSIFSLYGPIGWVPTVELTLHVRKRPVDGWILTRLSTFDLSDDLLIEDGVLWDESGEVVARCRQLALLAPDLNRPPTGMNR